MMKLLIVANWKMNPLTLKEAEGILLSVKKETRKNREVEVVICPPFIYLPLLLKKSALAVGAQDCFWLESGAYTGEISALMLKKLGCQYVIIGHSERRTNFGETDEVVNKKLKAALAAELNPIVCLGGTENERKEERIAVVIKKQIEAAFKDIPVNQLSSSRISIAYEPVWAIGTNNPCGIEESRVARLLIEKTLEETLETKTFKNLRLLYGGSVNKENAKDYIGKAGFVGLLVGGASLKPEFVEIIRDCSHLS